MGDALSLLFYCGALPELTEFSGGCNTPPPAKHSWLGPATLGDRLPTHDLPDVAPPRVNPKPGVRALPTALEALLAWVARYYYS